MSIGFKNSLLFVAVALVARISTAAESQTQSFAFSVVAVSGHDVELRGEDGCAWTKATYGCPACAFRVDENGVGGGKGSAPTGGVLVQVHKEDAELALTCLARKCAVVSEVSAHHREEHDLKNQQAVKVPASSRISIRVDRGKGASR